MKQIIQTRIAENLARARNLVAIYETHLMGSGQGRRAAAQTDVLRAAVVLLHACLEDFLRSLEYWKLPLSSSAVLDSIPFVGTGPNPKKVLLGELSAHRGKSVDELIVQSVNAYLERSNYNNLQEICSTLQAIGIDPQTVNQSFVVVEQMMLRRHQIVHRADRDEAGGVGNHRVRSIGRRKVYEWVAAVELFTNDILAAV